MALLQELRLEVDQDDFWPDIPAVKGLDGLAAARQLLQKYNVAGLLVGGLAREMWRGTTDVGTYDKHKDVDIVILSYSCDRHPEQWEGGIDWWVTHRFGRRATNGTRVGLIWQVELKGWVTLEPDIYLCPERVLKKGFKLLADYHSDNNYLVRKGEFGEPAMVGDVKKMEPEWLHWACRFGPSVDKHCKSLR